MSILNNAQASVSLGETALPAELYPLPGIESTNVVRVLFNGGGSFISSFKRTISDKKRLIPAALLAVVWTVLMLLPALEEDLLPAKILSWLTFARGGLKGGISGNIGGAVGGVIGKGLVAAFLTVIIADRSFFRQLKSGFSIFAKGFKGGSRTKASLLSGMGLALPFYNLLAADIGPDSTMAALACFFLSVRAISNSSGFVRAFFSSFRSRKNPAAAEGVNRFMSGWSAGFAIGIPVSAIPVSAIPVSAIPFGMSGYLLGAVFLIAAVIMAVAGRGKGGGK